MRNYPWEYVQRLPLNAVALLLEKAQEREQADRVWEQWLSLYPYMVLPSAYTKGNKPMIEFKPFSEFHERLTQEISLRPSREILDEAESIRKQVKGG